MSPFEQELNVLSASHLNLDQSKIFYNKGLKENAFIREMTFLFARS